MTLQPRGKKPLLQKPRQQHVKVHFINVEMTDKTHFVLLVFMFPIFSKISNWQRTNYVNCTISCHALLLLGTRCGYRQILQILVSSGWKFIGLLFGLDTT